MQQVMIHSLNDRYLVGLSVRTNNQASFVQETNKIGPLIARYFQENIWAMKSDELGGTRCYQADFEVFDARASNSNAASVDIFIGIHS